MFFFPCFILNVLIFYICGDFTSREVLIFYLSAPNEAILE